MTEHKATPLRDDFDSRSISSLTTVRASNKVSSSADTTVDKERLSAHPEDERTISSFDVSGRDPSSTPVDALMFGPPPDASSSLLSENDDSVALDPDLQEQMQEQFSAFWAAAKEEQRKRN